MIRVAFILLVHQNPEQIIRLVNKLDSPHTDLYVHIDSRAGKTFSLKLKEKLKNKKNVHFIKSYKCYWGDFSLVRATLEGVKNAINTNIKYDYFILLSGQDYPVYPIEDILIFLEKNKGTSFIEHTKFSEINWYEGGYSRTKYWFFRRLQRKKGNPSLFNKVVSKTWGIVRKKLPGRRFPNDFQLYGGSQWWCLTNEAVQFILEYLRKYPNFEIFFHHVEIPDEIFFQTLVLNSPYKDKVINENLRFMIWRDTTSSPSILIDKDYNSLINSAALFARKFDIKKDTKILNLIDDFHFDIQKLDRERSSL